MTIKKLFLTLCLLAGGVCFGTLKAEEIVLQDLYEVAPIDNSKEDWGKTDLPPGRIKAEITNGIVNVGFGKPAGNVQVVISRGDGSIFRQHSAFNPQQVSIDLQGATSGRYMLEVYTDTDALGGLFTVNN